ncbi:hypothetical protein [Pseudonocardia adelaidensis]|uniref:Uncharacterized protein n=1 Tax=Pseudonocardia adelaidensis TaxID=648754 RepID=A0ABP9NK20_9PSEU
MPRSVRALAAAGAVVVGVLAGGTAYTASVARSSDGTGVDPATDVMAPDDRAGVRMADYVVTTTPSAMPAPTTPARPTRPAETTRPPAPVEPAPAPG